MGTAVLEMPKGYTAPFEIGTPGAFFEPSPKCEQILIRQDMRLVKELISALDKQLLAVIAARSVPEFAKARDKAWPKYIRALRALQDTVSNLVSDDQFERLFEKGLAEISADLYKQSARLGEGLVEQADFTLWTMRKIRSLGHQIAAAGDPPAEQRAADLELVNEYRVASLWAQFHLDTLLAAMKFDRPIAHEIRPAIHDGLRTAVNAYAIMKEALLLRQPKVFPAAPGELPWDEEDERLLAASMRDLNAAPEDR